MFPTSQHSDTARVSRQPGRLRVTLPNTGRQVYTAPPSDRDRGDSEIIYPKGDLVADLDAPPTQQRSAPTHEHYARSSVFGVRQTADPEPARKHHYQQQSQQRQEFGQDRYLPQEDHVQHQQRQYHEQQHQYHLQQPTSTHGLTPLNHLSVVMDESGQMRIVNVGVPPVVTRAREPLPPPSTTYTALLTSTNTRPTECRPACDDARTTLRSSDDRSREPSSHRQPSPHASKNGFSAGRFDDDHYRDDRDAHFRASSGRPQSSSSNTTSSAANNMSTSTSSIPTSINNSSSSSATSRTTTDSRDRRPHSSSSSADYNDSGKRKRVSRISSGADRDQDRNRLKSITRTRLNGVTPGCLFLSRPLFTEERHTLAELIRQNFKNVTIQWNCINKQDFIDVCPSDYVKAILKEYKLDDDTTSSRDSHSSPTSHLSSSPSTSLPDASSIRSDTDAPPTDNLPSSLASPKIDLASFDNDMLFAHEFDETELDQCSDDDEDRPAKRRATP